MEINGDDKDIGKNIEDREKCKFCFQKEEYLSLRKEVENCILAISAIERNCLIAVSAIYVWLVTAPIKGSLLFIGWGVPLFVIVFSGLRVASLGNHVVIVGEYLQKIERYYYENEPDLGWETFFRKKMRYQGKVRVMFWSSFAVMSFVIWILSMILTGR